MPEETQGYKLTQPKQTLEEYNNMGMSGPSIPPHGFSAVAFHFTRSHNGWRLS